MRKVIIMLILCTFLLSLTSCFDSIEMDDLLYVIAIGVDKGISDKWRLTIQFPTMQEGGGQMQSVSGGSSGSSGHSYASIDAPSFFTGIDMLNASLPRKLDFTHAQIIVFSEELAEGGLIGEYIAPIARFGDIRRSSHVFVVKGKAMDFIKENKPLIGTTLSKNFQVLAHASENTGFFPHVTLENFYEDLKSPYGQTIAAMASVNDLKSFAGEGEPWGTEFKTGGSYFAGQLPRTGKNKIEVWGTALFNGDKMVDKLNGDETRFLLMIRGEFRQGRYTMKDPKRPEVIIALDVRISKKPEIEIDIKDENPEIRLKFQLDADILSVQSMIDYENPELLPLLEENFKKTVEEGIMALIKKCQDLNTDVFYFGENAAKNFFTIDEYESYNWNSRFKEARVIVDVDFAIRRTGTQIKSYPIKDPIGVE
ncbi:MAG: Ger(x)C family spore germination protein [Clostridiaceae bacterium]|nr:Ger(x)C family spore germination protein [Clostridiaceae bacterium]